MVELNDGETGKVDKNGDFSMDGVLKNIIEEEHKRYPNGIVWCFGSIWKFRLDVIQGYGEGVDKTEASLGSLPCVIGKDYREAIHGLAEKLIEYVDEKIDNPRYPTTTIPIEDLLCGLMWMYARKQGDERYQQVDWDKATSQDMEEWRKWLVETGRKAKGEGKG